MSAHTPGPWSKAGRDLDGMTFGREVRLHVFADADREAGGSGTIATIHAVSAGSGEANAALIAAAPKLADALVALHAAAAALALGAHAPAESVAFQLAMEQAEIALRRAGRLL